jgi:hypothetical protein
MSVRLLAVCCFICGTPAISAPRVLLRKTSHKGVRQPVQQVSKKLSPELGIKKSSDRGHLPVVIRKAGLNGPPGLGKSGRDPFQLWSINRRPQTRPASPVFGQGTFCLPWTAFGKLLQQARTRSLLWRYCIGWRGPCQRSRPALLS